MGFDSPDDTLATPTPERIARGVRRTWIADPEGREILVYRARPDPDYGLSGDELSGLVRLRRTHDRAYAGACSPIASGPGRSRCIDGLARAHDAAEQWRKLLRCVADEISPTQWAVRVAEQAALGVSLGGIGRLHTAPAGHRGAGRALERNRDLIAAICAVI